MATKAKELEGNIEPGAGVAEQITGELPPAFTFEGLKKQYGAKRGEELYKKISVAGGWGDFSLDVGWNPDLATKGISDEHREAVLAILSEVKQ